MEEVLFTPSQLKQIEEDAKLPVYSNVNVVHIGNDLLSIIRVSSASGLILAHGNSWTGYQHINSRHSPFHRTPYWDEDGKLGAPTKFRINLTSPTEWMTVGEKYLLIASKIYKSENFIILQNKNSDKFDLYVGKYKHHDDVELEYKLLVYINTKIIHTLYPNDKKNIFHKKKIVNLRKGFGGSKWDIFNELQTHDVPYYNSKNIEVFKILVRYWENLGCERWYLQENAPNGNPIRTLFLAERQTEVMVDMHSKATQINFMDVSWAEKLMKEILSSSLGIIDNKTLL